jgi:hypothetical protein
LSRGRTGRRPDDLEDFDAAAPINPLESVRVLTELLDVRAVDTSLDIPHIDIVDVQSSEVGVCCLYRVGRERIMNVVHALLVPGGI